MTRRLISVLFLLAALAAFVVSADEFSPTNLAEVDAVENGLRTIGRLQARALADDWAGELSAEGRKLADALKKGPGPFGEEFSLKAHLPLPNIKPDTRADAGKSGTWTMCVSNFRRRDKSIRFYWFENGRPDEKMGFDTVTLYLPEVLPHPMWADALTGRACEIPQDRVLLIGATFVIKGVPVRDTPIIVCDRSALPLVGEEEGEWAPPPPEDIVIYAGEPKEWTGDAITFTGGKWDLSRNRVLRIELENTSTNGASRLSVMDGNTGRSTTVIPAGFKGAIDVALIKSLKYPMLSGKAGGMQVNPFGRDGRLPEPSWANVPLDNLTSLTLDRRGFAPSNASDGELPKIIIRKITALVTDDTDGPSWFTMNEEEFFPFIDRYGQFIHKDWPNKTKNDGELKARVEQEKADLAAHPRPAGRDAFGGWTDGPQLLATGRFRLEKVNGKWWFVDPEGRLWWSHGIVRVTPSSAVTPLDGRKNFFSWLPEADDPFAAFYKTNDELLKPYYDKRNIRETFDFSSANLLRKYGPDWREIYADLCHRRLASWGFNTIANSSDRTIRRMNRTPYVERLETHGPRCKEQKSEGQWWPVPDPYAPEFRADLRAQLEANREELTSPWCLGIFVDNEHNWDGISEKTMREYFKVIREEIKRLDPSLLYFGCRFGGANEAVVKMCARYADAVSFNRYAFRLDAFRLPDGVDKPVIIGEFHFGTNTDSGLFKPSLVWTPDQKARADAYRLYVGDALDHPNLVGAHWHQFSDQATTGRFDGENANVGFTDVCDTPYAEMVAAAREVGATMYDRRWRAGDIRASDPAFGRTLADFGVKDDKVVHAKDFGFNVSNATAIIQQAIDSGATTVVVDAMPTPWYIEPLKLRSNQRIRLEPGAKILADKYRWKEMGKNPLFNVKGLKNVIIEGAGMDPEKGSLIGCFADYDERMKYCHVGEELVTGIYVNMSTNVVIRNLRIANCGCDGISVGGWRIPAKHVRIENVDLDDNHRQACSPMLGDDIYFTHVKFRNTRGTEPTAGCDIEPCYDVHPLTGFLFEDCEFGNNNGGGMIFPMSSIFPIDITVRRCVFHPEKGRSPIDVLARGDTYRDRDTPADVHILFEDCVVEAYGNDPAVNFATGPIFSCTFRNLTIREVPGRAVWRPDRKCAPVEFRLDRDYHGAFPPEKHGKVIFENVTATGFEGRPFIQFVDTLGKQDVTNYFSGVVTFNGKAVDTAAFNHKAMDIDAPNHQRFEPSAFAEPGESAFGDAPRSNCKPVPWGDWYEHAPCYTYYFPAKKGTKVAFSVVYPVKTDLVDFTKKLQGVHLALKTPAGEVDLGELHAGTNRFEYAVQTTGWHVFFPPHQDGAGNYVHVEEVTGARFAYQGDTVESSEMKFRLFDEAQDYTGYFEVPPHVECKLRVSRGTVELRDAQGRLVDKAVENEYAGRKILTFRASGDKPEIWSFHTPAGAGTRLLRFYGPLNGIWADSPDNLPRCSRSVGASADQP